MIIKEIYINNFGKLHNYSLKFDDEINIIYGQNESGKSTILSFIAMVFYGNSSKSKDISINDRRRYQPWNSNDMSGYIILSDDGKEYKIERQFGASNHTDIVNLFEMNTGRKIDIPNPTSPGEYFFGIGQEAFNKTLYMSSESMILENKDKNDEVTQKLLNLVTTGEEDISYKKLIENLDKKIESYISRAKNKGTLVDLETEINELRNNIETAKTDEIEKSHFSEQIEELEEKLEKSKKEKVIVNDLLNLNSDKNEILNNKKIIELEINNSNIDVVKEKKNLLEEELDENENSSLIFDFDIKDISIILTLIFVILAISVTRYLLFIPAIISLVFYIYNLKIKSKNKSLLIKQLKYDISKIQNEINILDKNISDLESEKYYMEEALKEIEYNMSLYDIDSTNINYENVQNLDSEIFQYKNNIIEIQTMAKERFRGKENLSSLENKLNLKLEEYRKHKNDYNLLIETKKLIQESFQDLEIGFSKILNDKASEIISNLTNNKYNKIMVSEDFDIFVEDSFTKNTKEWKYLSSGTIDLFYLALRLSIIELIIKDENKRILLMDDIFIRYDSIRANEAIKLISNSSESFSQMLLFTSHDISKYNSYDFKMIRL